MKKYLLIAFFSGSLLAYGQQNVTFEKKNFKDNIPGFKQAMDSIEAGEKFYKMGDSRYYMAIHFFLFAEKFNPNNDQLNYWIGQCMLSHNSAFKTQALPYLQKAYQLNPTIAPDINYLLARAYHLDMEWEKAKQQYTIYLQTLDQKKDADQIADALSGVVESPLRPEAQFGGEASALRRIQRRRSQWRDQVIVAGQTVKADLRDFRLRDIAPRSCFE